MMNIQPAWMDGAAAATYCGLSPDSGRQTINRWIRKGLIPSKFVGGDGVTFVKAEGLDIAMRKMRAHRLKRCGLKEAV